MGRDARARRRSGAQWSGPSGPCGQMASYQRKPDLPFFGTPANPVGLKSARGGELRGRDAPSEGLRQRLYGCQLPPNAKRDPVSHRSWWVGVGTEGHVNQAVARPTDRPHAARSACIRELRRTRNADQPVRPSFHDRPPAAEPTSVPRDGDIPAGRVDREVRDAARGCRQRHRQLRQPAPRTAGDVEAHRDEWRGTCALPIARLRLITRPGR